MHKNNKLKKWLLQICTILLLFILTACQATNIIQPAGTPDNNISISKEGTSESQNKKDLPPNKTEATELKVTKGRSYSTKDEVAAYIHQFKELPVNYITKTEAQKLGWDNAKGNLWEVTKQKSIGGDRFGNFEGLLPKEKGRQYYECDINYNGGYRSAERIIYSNDGLIFYTDDHYKTFKQLY